MGRQEKIFASSSRKQVKKPHKKKDYLKMIPYTWKLIRIRINENEIFEDMEIGIVVSFGFLDTLVVCSETQLNKYKRFSSIFYALLFLLSFLSPLKP